MGKQLTRTGGAHLPLDPETLTFDEEDGEPYGWDIGQIRFGSEALRELRADPAVQEAQQQLESSTVAEDEEVDEVGERFGVERRMATDDHHEVVLGAVGGVDRGAGSDVVAWRQRDRSASGSRSDA